jgi:flagellum-specific ATP synthase
VLQSISRVRNDVTDAEQQRWTKRVLALTAVYQDIEDLVNIGAYAPGVNAEYDLAVQARPRIVEYLQQDYRLPATFEQSKKKLADLMAWIESAEKVLRVQQAAKIAKK